MDASKDFAGFIRRIRSGDEAAARELIQQYEQELRIIARVRLHDPRMRRILDSMDVCQSILANFFARAAIGQFDLESPQDLMNLLATMVRNKITDYARAQNAQRRGAERSNSQNIDTLDLAGNDETPSTIVSNRELLEIVHELLSQEERAIAELRRDGQTWDAISARIGQPAETLKKRFSRAIDRVSIELGLQNSVE